MGTSNAFGGAGGGTPLIPSWLDDAAGGSGALAPSPGNNGDGANGDDGGEPSPNTPVPDAPAPRKTTPAPGASDRFTSARTNFSKFSRSGGNDQKSLGRAASNYVSKSVGGARQAARRMGSSRTSGAGLVNFLNSASFNGAREALRSLNLDGLAGRPIEQVFAGLADFICPAGGSIDEGIARDAFIETIADLANAGVTNIDQLEAGQIQTVFELYVTHTIEARICNDIGTKILTLPSDVQEVQRVQMQLRDFIQRGVSDAVNASGVNIQSLSPNQVTGFVDQIYEAAFEALQTIGEGMAK
ncbi:Qat anti-phage system associated protein QatB [Pseudovibrio brasiliensis]|uniref:Uncharacterized protein n=1 Tax=Pseudovibrio brasiliensis TaxID=1898042 RepID=A0ABX8AYZ2_9HYPH|nr:Qat anti-phage system associated protein QatB [Pseudovibrio brasiliensis]QUS59050.1 hypothetical protein KGB56_25895 [Pseudovibrio brasiliensis]